MAATATPRAPSGARRGLAQRLTGKVGPLPVWGWALLLLAAGYLVYRTTAGKSASSSATTDTTSTDAPATTSSGDTGSPPASGQGGPADNLSGDVLTQLSGLAGQVDALTGLIQSTPAFDPGQGDAGSGSTTPNTGTSVPAAAPKATASTPARPSAHPPAPARVRYYTYKPGQAPKGQAKNQAPSRGPAGTTLHFARGKGYYYA